MTETKLPSVRLFNFVVSGLIFIGLLFIGLSSSTESINLSSDQYLFFRKQIIWIGLGFLCFLFGRFLNLNFLKKLSKPIYFLGIFLLILVLIPQLGVLALGASRRLDVGLFAIQPSEIIKIILIIFFAHVFSKKNENVFRILAYYLLAPLILIILEPNMSTAVLVAAIIFSMFYLSGGNIFAIFGIGLLAILTSVILIYTSPYRKARLTTGYHSNQLILSIGSGGLFGKGLGNSEQKYRFLPKIPTDSILAIIGEETGFFGISLLISGYIFIISYLFKLSSLLINSFDSLIVSGISLWITYQTLINFAAITGIIPLTGQPLPFISYGGSSLISLLFSFGLVENILYSSNHGKNTKEDSSHRHPSYSGHRTNSRTSKRSGN